MSEKQLLAKKKDELVALCKEKGLSTTGTKAVLVERIMGASGLKQALLFPKKEKTPPSVIDKYSKQNVILTVKNRYGNYEHQETGFVFDKTTHKVIGRQKGEFIEPLTREHISFCDIHGLDYEVETSLKGNEVGRVDLDTEMIQLAREADGTRDDEDSDEEPEEL